MPRWLTCCFRSSQTAAAGTAGETINRFAKSPVVGKPLVNEYVELPIFSHKTTLFETGQHHEKRQKVMLVCISG
jgi:hypothetical protein